MSREPPIAIAVEPLQRAEVARLARGCFGDMVKYVVDVRREQAAVGGELHADAEQLRLEAGSEQADLWGANPGRGPDRRIEFTALINIRPTQGNGGMEIHDLDVRERIRDITFRLRGRGEAL